MKIVILSGGSGKRLWPLSNEIRSKQFLKVIKNENSEVESMLQRVYKQLAQVNLENDCIVATSFAQQESIRSQMNQAIPLVLEPERRNTFPSIVLSCAYLHDILHCELSETILVMPVDPYVQSNYFKSMQLLDEMIGSDVADILLMGVKPMYPSEKYGYIIPAYKKNKTNFMKVEKFIEKPSVDKAKILLENGALWNCGILAFKLGYVLNIAQKYKAGSTYKAIQKNYCNLPNTSFDYEVLENNNSVAVTTYGGEWKDLGTWNTLTEVMTEKPIGRVKMSETCKNTHIINELDIPIVAIGAHDMIIVASPDGILVSDKNESSYIKKYVDHIDLRPMFEERSWGQYSVLDMAIGIDGIKTLTKRKVINEKAIISYQKHENRSEVWTILSGQCIVMIDEKKHEALAGDSFSIGKGIGHGLFAITTVQMLEVQVGFELVDDGTEEIEIDWHLETFIQ